MKNMSTIADKVSISLSVLCTIHCLALPLAIVFLPTLASLPLADEAFHVWMVYFILPISAFALTLGCKKHKRYRLLFLGGIGLAILVFAAFAGHDVLGEFWEKALTVLGASVIALGHYWNYKLCQQHDSCGCAEDKDQGSLT